MQTCWQNNGSLLESMTAMCRYLTWTLLTVVEFYYFIHKDINVVLILTQGRSERPQTQWDVKVEVILPQLSRQHLFY